MSTKKKIALQIVGGGETFLCAFEEEETRKEWMTALEANKGKEVGGSLDTTGSGKKKKQSTAMRIKKKMWVDL